MSTPSGTTPSASNLASRLARPAQVIIVSSVMFTFISYWRTAAVVLCDLASTSYYIGGIVETAIGPAAPWFILGVMLFSYAVRSVYIESCSLFTRGGVYKVVKEAMGGFLAKLSVSALMFDYILTGPISGVSAGQYLVGLLLETLETFGNVTFDAAAKKSLTNAGSVLIATLITLYFFRQNVRGLHESSDKALKIMIATTVMAVLVLGWCGYTLAVRGAVNGVPPAPDLNPHVNFAIDVPEGTPPVMQDPLGFLGHTSVGASLRNAGGGLLSLVGLLGIAIAFGHSILAMSGEETLAQVYREVESPKLKNFKKAAFIVFLYSLFLTASISFLAVMLIPDAERMPKYNSNLISGVVMNLAGPKQALLLLNAFVVVVGFLILAGAVNTAIIGSNGVLNRVAEDGVLPDWFLKPHKKFGTTSRILWLILILQLFTIFASWGDVILLGEAYAFGVVWSFVFKALAMVVLRFKDRTHREYKVPLNVRIRGVEVPIGLGLIFLVLLTAAILNLLTKELATVSGLGFTAAFLVVFVVTERVHERRRKGEHHKHLEQFNRKEADDLSMEALGVERVYRKLVAIRSPQNLTMLEKALAETDPDTTAVLVMTAKVAVPDGDGHGSAVDLDAYDQQLMTAVVQKAEHAGKEVKPLIVPTNNPLHAVLSTAQKLQVHELVMGASNKYTADEQLEQVAFYWISMHGGQPAPLTVRILGAGRDLALDLGGGNRIPKISERRAKSVAELRAAGVGVDRVLLVHDGSPLASDLFQAVLTMLDPQVDLALLPVAAPGDESPTGQSLVRHDTERAEQLGRRLDVLTTVAGSGEEVVRLARAGDCDLIVLGVPEEPAAGLTSRIDARALFVLDHAHCRVFLAAAPLIPREVIDTRPSAAAS